MRTFIITAVLASGLIHLVLALALSDLVNLAIAVAYLVMVVVMLKFQP